ncbi:MAG: hypothetical protein NVS4B11_27450 [Ktedonobacteraceae bacterium]
MEIEGTYTLQAKPEEVWQRLRDQQALLHTIPEIQQLERIDEHSHSLALHLTYTPLLGTYYGRIRVAEHDYPHHCRIIIESVRDTQNTISGEAIVDLRSHEDATVFIYKGTIQLNKLGTQLQATVVKGAVKLLVQQLFTALEEQLWQHRAKEKTVKVEAELINITTVQRAAPPSRFRRNQEKTRPASLLQRIVHLLRLGKGEFAQEEQWTQRIRRASYASMLLFLVWVGTRLPRRL